MNDGERRVDFFRADDDAVDFGPITLIQVFTFLDDDHVLLYRRDDGRLDVPTCQCREGETLDATVCRVVSERLGAEVLEHGLVGYMRDTVVAPEPRESYRLGYWARVKPLDDSQGLHRSVEVNQVVEKLGYGQLGEVILEMAMKKYRMASLRRV